MSKQHISHEDNKAKVHKPEKTEQPAKKHVDGSTTESTLTALQHQVGNRAVQRLLQRSGDGPFELDDDTAGRINQERGSGQALDEGTSTQLGTSMGQDFSDVRVHTSPESDSLNKELGAKAFTTGKDIYFREGAYDPHSSGGQELIAHELTHVVQQGSGAVSGGGQMRVNPPDDAYEHEAASVAKSATGGSLAGGGVQRAGVPEEEEVQTQAAPEEEEVQTQEVPEEEVQTQAAPEEEEVQTQEVPEEEVQTQAAPEEEEVQTQEMPEEEEVQTQEMPEEEELAQTQEMPEEEEELAKK